MRRPVLVLLLAALAATAGACASAPDAIAPRYRGTASPTEPAVLPAGTFTPNVGERYAYRLYTHCGIVQAQFAGAWWKADPALSDGSGNPPQAWTNPFHDGTMELRDDDTLLFRGGDERTARFVRAPSGFTPALCD